MNPRDAVNFFRSPTGAFAGFCALVVIALVIAKGFQKPGQPKPSPLVASASAAPTKPQVVETIERDMQPYNPPKPKPEVLPNDLSKQEEKRVELPPLSLFGDNPPAEKPLSKFYAPYGRLIPCELVITIDSSVMRTPIVGLITEDIYHLGRLIIPAGIRTDICASQWRRTGDL